MTVPVPTLDLGSHSTRIEIAASAAREGRAATSETRAPHPLEQKGTYSVAAAVPLTFAFQTWYLNLVCFKQLVLIYHVF